MKKTTLEEATEIFKKNFEKWYKEQSNPTSGYEYEKSYVEMMRKVSKEVLEKSAQDTSKGRKKNS